MDSANVFTPLLPLNSDHVMIPLGGYNCTICYTQLSAWKYMYVQTEQYNCNPKGIIGGNKDLNT